MLLYDAEAGVARLTLNRPEARNALNRALIGLLEQAIQRAEADDAVRVLLLDATGPHFAAGADIAEMAAMSAAEALAQDFCGCCDALGRTGKPVLVAVQGLALGGGCELVEMADIVLAADSAGFGHPEIRLGTLSGAGGTQRLPRSIGKAKALDLLLTGRIMDAREAERAGLVSRVVPAAALADTANEVAAQLAALSPVMLRLIKQSVRRAFEAPLEDALAAERRLFQLSFAHPHRQEGMAAFLEKRAASFT